ncbi:MAG: WbqC family protein [Flavobacteriales bacterium]|nr:WbqC family protein [Flavobacteriales bacterium]
MKIAIMQPYIFPYVGYFQLVNAVDVFVFYDDVNFIKRGWINRNNILVNHQLNLFSIPLLKASQNKLINETHLAIDEKWLKQFYNTLEFNYKKAPHFEPAFQLVKKVFETNHQTIADLTMASIREVSNHLGLSTVFEQSSESYPETKGMDKADRLIRICQLKGIDTYVNPSGGKELYNKVYFKEQGIELFFIENKISGYRQFDTNFVPGLSMIDILMFNDRTEIINMLNDYSLI